MIRTLALAALVALSSCATTSAKDLRTSDVAETFHSAKRPAQIAQCLAESLSKWGSPAVYPSDAGTSVSFTTSGNVLLLIDISGTSDVTVRRAVAIVSYRKGVSDCI